MWPFFLIMTDTLTSQYIGLFSWITLCVKRWRFISSGISRRRFRIVMLTSLGSRRPRRIFLVLKMKTVWSVETPRTTCQYKWHLVPRGLNLKRHSCENLKSSKTVPVLSSSVLFCGSRIVGLCNIAGDIFLCFLGVFAKLQRATISFVVFLSVRPSAWNNSAPTGRIFLKFDIRVFFEKLSKKFTYR